MGGGAPETIPMETPWQRHGNRLSCTAHVAHDAPVPRPHIVNNTRW